MLHDLAAQDSSTALARRLRRYTSPAVLAIDEVGYLAYDARYADLLFEVVSRRYQQQRPRLLTTNKAFGEWNQIFPNAAGVVSTFRCWAIFIAASPAISPRQRSVSPAGLCSAGP